MFIHLTNVTQKQVAGVIPGFEVEVEYLGPENCCAIYGDPEVLKGVQAKADAAGIENETIED